MIHRILPAVIVLLLSLQLVRPANSRQAEHDDAARRLRIAAMAEWVSRECGEPYVGQFEAGLLPSAQGVLRRAEAGDAERARAAVRQHAFTFKSRRDACRSLMGRLKSVQ